MHTHLIDVVLIALLVSLEGFFQLFYFLLEMGSLEDTGKNSTVLFYLYSISLRITRLLSFCLSPSRVAILLLWDEHI